MSNKSKGNIALLLTAMAWGSGFIAQKLGNQVMPPIAFNAIRQLMAALVLFPFMLLTMKRSGYFSAGKNSEEQLSYKRRKMLMAGIVCGFFLMAGTTTQQIGLLTVSAGKSGFISSVYIVFVPIFSIVLGVRVRPKSLACVAMAMAGFAIMSLKEGLGGATAGDWLTLVSAAAFAAQIVSVNYFVDKDNAILISVLQMFFGGVMGMILSLCTEPQSLAPVIECMPILLYSTFVPTSLGYTLQIVGQKYTDSSTAALLMSLESVFALIFGFLFLREVMTVRELIGSAIILAATIIGQQGAEAKTDL